MTWNKAATLGAAEIRRQEEEKRKQEELIKFVRKPIYLRSDSEIDSVMKTSRDIIKYFVDMKFNDEQLHQVLRRMNFEFFAAGTNVFEYGEIGDKFYLII